MPPGCPTQNEALGFHAARICNRLAGLVVAVLTNSDDGGKLTAKVEDWIVERVLGVGPKPKPRLLTAFEPGFAPVDYAGM